MRVRSVLGSVLLISPLFACGQIPTGLTTLTSRPASDVAPKGAQPVLFVDKAPASERFQEEFRFILKTGQLSQKEYGDLETEIRKAELDFGVPKGLMWCLLFQESRFDRFKNATKRRLAKGLGQFTSIALEEINTETNRYYEKTGEILAHRIQPDSPPVTFDLTTQDGVADLENRRARKLPPQSRSSYFKLGTAVAASAAYLNNRYRQLMKMLERENLHYDPQVLWMYAAAAYNKGARTVYVLLSEQRAFGGDQGVSEILNNVELSYSLLTHRELLDTSLKDLWPEQTRNRYLSEMTRNMTAIHSCATPQFRDADENPSAGPETEKNESDYGSGE